MLKGVIQRNISKLTAGFLVFGFIISVPPTLRAENRYFFPWSPDTLIIFPGDSLRLELMLENDDVLQMYGFKCPVSSVTLFDSVVGDWYGGMEETTAVEAGNLNFVEFGGVADTFGGFADAPFICNPGVPPDTHVAIYLHCWVSGEVQPGVYTISFTPNSQFYRCSGGDVYPALYDGFLRIPESPPGDVGPISIISPPTVVYEDTTYIPEVRLKNFGSETLDSIPVYCFIDTNGVEIYVDTTLIDTLYDLTSTWVTFSHWMVPAAYIDYIVTVVSAYPGDPNPTNDTLSQTIHGVVPGDVGPIAITSPPDTVWVDSTYAPSAAVTNFTSDSAEALSVICEISFYDAVVWSDTKQLPGLGGNDTISVTFDGWTVLIDLNYYVTVFTVYDADTNSTNDTLTTAVYGVYHPGDVGPISATNLPRTVYKDTTYTPEAMFRNFGSETLDSIPVYCFIDTNGVEIYVDTTLIDTLYDATSTWVTFSHWMVPAAYIDYIVTVVSAYPGDPNPTNDTLSQTIHGVVPGDVGPIAITSPPDTVWVDSTYAPSAAVTNFTSDSAEALSVICEISFDDAMVWSDTKQLSGLGGNDTISVTFDGWTVPVEGLYDIIIFTVYDVDTNSTNDILASIVYSTYPPGDIGPVSITSPPETVFVHSVYTPSVSVVNFTSDTVVAFSVVCNIDTSENVIWSDTTEMPGIAGNDTIRVLSKSWKVPEAYVDYNITVFTIYNDLDPSNDTLSISVYSTLPPLGDIGPVLILNPPDTVYVYGTYTPRVEVGNFTTDSTGFFSVYCSIDTAGIVLWADSVDYPALGVRDTVPIDFADWTVSAVGEYTLIVFTVYSQDEVPANDTISTVVYAVEVIGLWEEFTRPLIPKSYGLFQSCPNPMNSKATIFYQISKTGLVTLRVYDSSGRAVRTLIEETQEPGHYTVQWDGKAEDGREVPSGIYFYRMNAHAGRGTGEFTSLKKLVVIR